MRKFNIVARSMRMVAFFMGVLICMSCNKDFTNMLPEFSKNDTLGMAEGKKNVLFIVMDGVRGDVLEAIKPKNITSITKNAIYSYDALADYQRDVLTQASAWTTLMSGVDYTKHSVITDDFTGFDPIKTPTIFSRLYDEIPNIRTVSFSSDVLFNEYLAQNAALAKKFSNDDEVINAAVQELANEDPALLVAQLGSAEIAADGDYSKENANYANALTKIDAYVGQLIEALQARKLYAKENWMVVIASSKGGGTSGGQGGSNIYMDKSRNGFIAFYNPKFKAEKFIKPNMDALPYEGVSPKYTGANNHAAQSDVNIANFGSDKEATLRFNIRWDQGSTIYPSFVTKRASFAAGVVGWTMFVENETIGINLSQTGQGNTQRLHTRVVADGKWHNVVVKFWNENNKRFLKLFVDGIPAPAGNLDITGLGNLNTTSPLRLGSIGDANVNCLINDFAIYNIALPDEAIIQTSNRTPLNPGNDAYFDKLIGYWRATENTGDIKDNLGLSAPFKMMGNASWASFSDVSPNLKPEIGLEAFTAVPNSVDIATMIYNWLNISVPKGWDLMGKFYKPSINLPKD